MRRLLHPLLVFCAAAAAPAALPASAAAASVTITGHGFGHGVGMAQWGAQGFALHGLPYTAILSHYYPGTTIGSAPLQQVRVLLQQNVAQVSASSSGGLTARDEASGATAAIAPGATATVTGGAGGFSVSSAGTAVAGGWAGPVSLEPTGSDPVSLAGAALNGTSGRAYRGRIRVLGSPGALSAVDVVGLEDYLDGVVPSEMPASWQPAALEAQAVAARSYAIATRKPASAAFDLYADTRSQAYGGIPAERPATSAAVALTAGQIVLWNGTPAVTYFSSSSGGRTAAVEEAFPGAKPVPYLVAVDDPYDTISPDHDWSLTVDLGALARALGYAGTIASERVEAFPSGRVRDVVLGGSAGAVTVPAGTVRSALGLRSTWFSLGAGSVVAAASARLAPPRVQGAEVLLQGTAPTALATLEAQRTSAWRPVSTRPVAADGSVTFTRPVGEARAYRLHLPDGTITAPVSVRVASGIVLRGSPGGRFHGRLFPPQARGTVVLQAVRHGRWAWVAAASVRAGGRFRFATTVARGRWRVRWKGAGPFAAASSTPLPVPFRRLSWVPTDPLAGAQWNMTAIHAWDYWSQNPAAELQPLAPTVAVIDGGIDARSPDLLDAAGTSVVVATKDLAHARHPDLDHGTAVAGLIAARAGNGIGIAGADPFVRLLDVRVVDDSGNIDPAVEAAGIRWAVDQGASVVNLSLGGARDPHNRALDEYSPLEAAAVRYAFRHGAVLVAASGNDGSSYASYPAALPHVIGVGAVDRTLQTPAFSNRDPAFVDLAAPGVGLVSTVSRASAKSGLSQDAPDGDVVTGGLVEGTSFAAPEVSAAAALLVASGQAPSNSQIGALLELSATDIAPPQGSPGTTPGRDPLTGFGLLDVQKAMQLAAGPLPPADTGEPNDTPASATGIRANRIPISATIAVGDDRTDLYSVPIRRGRLVRAVFVPQGGSNAAVSLLAWKPGTADVQHGTRRLVAAAPPGPAPLQRLTFRATQSGYYLIEVLASSGATAYSLHVTSR